MLITQLYGDYIINKDSKDPVIKQGDIPLGCPGDGGAGIKGGWMSG